MTDQPPSPIVAVFTGQRPEDVTGEIAERIKELLWEYRERTTLPAVIGVLRIVEHELLAEFQ